MRRLLLVSCLLLYASLSLFAQANADVNPALNSEGKEFWICFQRNFRDYDAGRNNNSQRRSDPLTLKLFITAHRNARVQIEIDGINYYKDINVRGGTVVNVDVDTAAQVRGSGDVERLAVHITADNPIAVYGLNRRFQTTDTYLALPVSVLGKEYMVMAYEKLSEDLVSQVAVIATEDDTQVTMVPTVRTADGFPANQPYTLRLSKGDVYQFRSMYDRKTLSDLTGTYIKANKKIAVFSGHSCAYVPSGVRACNHLVEQMPPLHSWGRQFYIGTLARRTSSTFRVLASQPGTVIFENFKKVRTLDAGQFYEKRNQTANTQITASKPVLVAQYAQGYQNGDSIGDPMMILVSPSQQFLPRYRFATPVNGAWRHYINVIVPRNAVRTMLLDGQPVDSRRFRHFVKSGFMMAQLEVPYGTHTLECAEPFGMYSYGFGFGSDAWDAYGNMGGQGFGEVVELPDSLAPTGEGQALNDSMIVYIRDERVQDRGLRSLEIVSNDGLNITLPRVEEGVPQIEFGVGPQTAGVFGRAIVQATDLAFNSSYFTLCYNYSRDEGKSVFYLADGAEADCQPDNRWYWGAFLALGINMYDPDFSRTGPLTTRGTFSGSNGGGGIGGAMAGGRLTRDWGASLRLSLDTYGGEILAPDSTSSMTPDSIVVQEGFLLDLSNVYLTLALAGEYYLSSNYYLLGGLQASLALSSGARLRQVILTPDNLRYSQTNSSERTVFDEGLSSITTLRTAGFAGFGTMYPVWGKVSAFGELRYTHFFADIIDDGDWGLRQISLTIGAKVRL